jgi:sn-glycerol 3-phosphate transport system ATP-binding protein
VPGTTVEVGVRPEAVVPVPPDDARAQLVLDVDFAEELGATRLLHGRVEGADFVVQTGVGDLPATEAAAHDMLLAGAAGAARRIGLTFGASDVHLFDPASGARLP